MSAVSAVLEIETSDFAGAAQSMYRDVADPARHAVLALSAALDGCGAMAGSDPGGASWAATYDNAATIAMRAGEDVVNGAYRLSSLFAQSARNYAAADAASSARARDTVVPTSAALPADTSVGLGGAPPSAAGGSSGTPTGWWLVEHTVGYAWPSGHQARLRVAASALATAAGVLADRADFTMLAAIPFGRDRLPEVDDVRAVCQTLCAQLRQLSSVYQKLAGACEQFARHIDEVHSQVEHELISLGEQTAVIEGVGAVVSMCTFGAAQVPTQAIEASRVATVGLRVAGLIRDFTVAIQGMARTLVDAADDALAVAGRMRAILDLRIGVAAVDAVKALPGVRRTGELFSTAQLALIGRRDWPKFSAILQAAAREKGNFGLGTVTKKEAEVVGRAWVGDGAKLSENGKAWVSRDGLRQYRMPSYKRRGGGVQANLQTRRVPDGPWRDNGHLSVKGKP